MGEKMARKNFIDGFHINTIKKLLENKDTPQWIKQSWIEKVEKAGYKDKIKNVI